MASHPVKWDAILDAALICFSDQGYFGARVPDIAQHAGVGAGTLYRYFDSKQLLVNAVYRREKQRLMAWLLDGLDLGGEPRSVFDGFWQRLAGYARSHPASFAFLELHHHGEYLDGDNRALEEQSLLPIAQGLEAARAAGRIRDLEAPILMALIWGALVGLVKAERLGYLSLTDEVVSAAGAACWDLLRGNVEGTR